MASFNREQLQCNFQNWMIQQQQDLEELLRALPVEDDLKEFTEKGVKHFEDYCEKRALMAKHDAACFLCPPWCSSFEKAFMWSGGCRPSLCIRLLYYVSGSELDEQLNAILSGERKENVADLTAAQLHLIDALHCKTIKEENKFAARIAALQEEIADDPIAMIAQRAPAAQVGEWSPEVERAVGAQSKALAEVVADADRLRLDTLKEMISILTPLQAVELLIATKKLHISVHSLGHARDNKLPQHRES